ncbi:uncharacterized protein LOC143185930, partial [Calliopsis andreniformis]|uniref:uncharacterized protein LOC143185930 n=1 Tax=Calliopsis andreniformis TaxID=337506 RepID=UPI003FCE7650
VETSIFRKIALTHHSRIIIIKSEGLHLAVCQSDWLSLKSKEAKCLILIISKSSTLLYITAGKLFPLSLVTFCNILKISLSYITFLMTKL